MWVKRIFATISIKDLEVRLLLNSTKKVYYFCKKEHTASLLYDFSAVMLKAQRLCLPLYSQDKKHVMTLHTI